jgi:hypothetical protein
VFHRFFHYCQRTHYAFVAHAEAFAERGTLWLAGVSMFGLNEPFADPAREQRAVIAFDQIDRQIQSRRASRAGDTRDRSTMNRLGSIMPGHRRRRRARAWPRPITWPRNSAGGGGHGLATGHGIAVLEKGWIGGGNVGRNTTIIRSNYLLPATSRSTNCR